MVRSDRLDAKNNEVGWLIEENAKNSLRAMGSKVSQCSDVVSLTHPF